MDTNPFEAPVDPVQPSRDPRVAIAGAAYGLAAGFLCYPLASAYTDLQNVCGPGRFDTVGLEAPPTDELPLAVAVAALSAAVAAGLAVALFSFLHQQRKTPGWRLIFAFLITWATAVVAVACVSAGAAFSEPASAFFSGLIVGGFTGVVVSPAGMVPWAMLEVVLALMPEEDGP